MVDETLFRGSRLCVVGSICRDIKAAPLAPGGHLLQDGETPAGFITETIGGGGANSALAAAGLGAEARFAGKVGADALGDQLEQALQRQGVTSFVRHDAQVRTGSSIVLGFTNGSRHFISCQPNNLALAFDYSICLVGIPFARKDILSPPHDLAGRIIGRKRPLRRK